ncbi:MAG: 2TM domain-containing protein [Burkholderiaceae bacterium]
MLSNSTEPTRNDDPAVRARLRVARRRAGARMGFLIHLGVYLAVNLVLVSIDLMSASPVRWAHYPLMGWGLGLAIHGLAVHLLPQGQALHRRLVARELQRLQTPAR